MVAWVRDIPRIINSRSIGFSLAQDHCSVAVNPFSTMSLMENVIPNLPDANCGDSVNYACSIPPNIVCPCVDGLETICQHLFPLRLAHKTTFVQYLFTVSMTTSKISPENYLLCPLILLFSFVEFGYSIDKVNLCCRKSLIFVSSCRWSKERMKRHIGAVLRTTASFVVYILRCTMYLQRIACYAL